MYAGTVGRPLQLLTGRSDAANFDVESSVQLDWLSWEDHESELNRILKKRTPGTGQWLFRMGPFKQWLRQSGEAFFCHGMPGSGKSVLAAAVIDKLGEIFHSDSSVRICYIFCKSCAPEPSVLSLMASILRQMCQVQPSLPQAFQDLYDVHSKQGTMPSVDDVCSAVEELVRMSSRTFIVVDALDELEPSTAQQFISRLFSVQHHTQANIFATSRFIYNIVERFKNRQALIMENCARESDVERYLDSNMERMPMFVRASAEAQLELKRIIVGSTNGMYVELCPSIVETAVLT